MEHHAAKTGAIGVDHGTKRTGFAAVDPLRMVVTPLHAATGGSDGALADLAKLLGERDVSHLIVGYPLNMDGTAGGRAADVDRFIESASARFPNLIIVRQDERLTTKEAESRLKESGFHGSERKARRDPWSAMILLEDWIRDGEPA